MDKLATEQPALNRFILVGFAIFQCFLGAGVVFGWTSILPMLEKEGIYNEYCEPDQAFCNAQSIQLHFAFTIAASSSMVANLVLGLVFDKYGPRVGKVLSFLPLMAGTLLMGRAQDRRLQPQALDFFLPGMALVAFGGTGLQLCSIHLSNLFPEAKSLVTCLIVGALQLSFFIFGIFNFLYQHTGLSQRQIFDAYTVLLLLNGIGAFFVDPSRPFQLSEEEEEEDEDPAMHHAHPHHHHHELLSPIRLPSVFKKGETSLLLSTPQQAKYKRSKRGSSAALERDVMAKTSSMDLSKRSFKTQVLSPPFLLLSLLFSIGTLWCNYFLGSVVAQLRWKQLPDFQIERLMGYFGVILPGGVVFIPLVGYLLEVLGYLPVTFLCCVVSLAFTLLFISSTQFPVLVLSFVLYTLFRTIVFSLVFAYLGHTFGFKNFGALSGIAFCIAALAGLLQTPITELGDFTLVGYLQVGSLLLTFSLPCYDLARSFHWL